MVWPADIIIGKFTIMDYQEIHVIVLSGETTYQQKLNILSNYLQLYVSIIKQPLNNLNENLLTVNIITLEKTIYNRDGIITSLLAPLLKCYIVPSEATKP